MIHNLLRHFREHCRTSCVTDYIVYQDLVKDIGVYLVSYDAWIVGKKDNTQSNLSVSLFAFLLGLKNNNKKNLADLVPACWVVFTLL